MSSIGERLVAAVQAGDLVNLRALLSQQDALPDDNIGWALSKTARVGCVESCRVLWEALSPQGKQKFLVSDSSNSYDYRVIQMTVNGGQLEIVRLFIEEFKWNINRKDMSGNTPLYYATIDSRIEICRYLLENGANVNRGTMESGIEKGPLWFAVRSGNTDIVRLLLQYCGADQVVGHPLHNAVKYGFFELVRLFIAEFKWNVNQQNYDGYTPLCFVGQHVEMARFLLENGANVNLGGRFGPLEYAVDRNYTEVARLFLVEYHANPNLNRRPVEEVSAHAAHLYPRMAEVAIKNGNVEILRLLLAHGDVVGYHSCTRDGTVLNILLRSYFETFKTKLSIARLLVDHAKDHHATAELMQVSFDFAINVAHFTCTGCRILLVAGIAASTASLYRAFQFAMRVEYLPICQLLVREYQVDPFLQEGQDDDDNDSDGLVASSPFQAAARLADTSIFECFLGVWDERFASTGGKNSDGDYPIHLACCDSKVSFQAIQLLVNRHPDALGMVDGEQGLLPFHFAATWNASLDVIFYLLQHCPDALGHVGNGTAAVGQRQLPTLDGDHTHGSASESACTHDHLEVCGPSPKKSKTTH